MIFRTLTNHELQRVAEGDSRYEVDPLFTELVHRLYPADSGRYDGPRRDHSSAKPLVVDAHRT